MCVAWFERHGSADCWDRCGRHRVRRGAGRGAHPGALVPDQAARGIASTPSAYTGADGAVAAAGAGEACADEIVFDTNAGIARFGATAPAGTTAPALEVIARGYEDGPYRATTAGRAGAGRLGGHAPARRAAAAAAQRRLRHVVRAQPRGPPIDLVGTQTAARHRVRRSRQRAADADRAAAAAAGARPAQPALARRGMTTHAATLKPFGAWWWWVLALALVTLAPLGVWLAMRTALAADAADGRSRARRSRTWPPRLRRRVAAIPGWAILAAVGALAVVWFFYWGSPRTSSRTTRTSTSTCRAGCRTTSRRRCGTSTSTAAACSGSRCGCSRSRRRCSTRRGRCAAAGS